MASGDGKPNFDYLTGDASRWSTYIDTPAVRLSDLLYKTRDSWGICSVCDAEYPLNMTSHLTGRAHFKKVQQRLNYGEPQSPEHLQAFIQVWELERGYGSAEPRYFFNHITGEQGFGTGSSTSSSGNVARPASQAISQQVGAPNHASNGHAADAHDPRGYHEAMQTKEAWRKFMEVPGKQLEDALHAATGQWGGMCHACSAEMTRGANDHMQSQNHWKKLWNRCVDGGMEGRLPAANDALGLVGQPWMQVFETPKGRYAFNLLTGEQSFEASSPANLGSPPVAKSAPPTLAPPAAAPFTAGGDPWAEAEVAAGWRADQRARPVPSTLAPLAKAPPPNSSPGQYGGLVAQPRAPPSDVRLQGEESIYKAAFDSKEKWRTYMEPLARSLESRVHAETGQWSAQCEVCDADMSRGIGDHLPSMKHWKALWSKLGSALPEPNDAHAWTRPWVQKIPTPKGVLLFNHVTGAVSSKAELEGSGPPSSSYAPATAPSPAQAPQAPPHCGMYSGPVKTFDLGKWCWERHVQASADQLHKNLGAQALPIACSVCSGTGQEVVFGEFCKHLSSDEHYKLLQSKLATVCPQAAPAGGFEVQNGLWIQEMQIGGWTAHLNHMTLDVSYR